MTNIVLSEILKIYAPRYVAGYYDTLFEIYEDIENIKHNKPTIKYAYTPLFRKIWEHYEFDKNYIPEAFAITVMYGAIIADIIWDKQVVDYDTSIAFLKEFSKIMGCNWKEFAHYITNEDEFFEACGNKFI